MVPACQFLFITLPVVCQMSNSSPVKQKKELEIDLNKAYVPGSSSGSEPQSPHEHGSVISSTVPSSVHVESSDTQVTQGVSRRRNPGRGTRGPIAGAGRGERMREIRSRAKAAASTSSAHQKRK
jgi:hypothetical protein